MITVNMTPGTKVIELGGGACPQFHPNVDVRQCFDPIGIPTVDFTHNFDEPFGDKLQSEEWDGVFSHFAMEHISYRKVRQFISEVFRILKPGGKAIIVIPNTKAQIAWAAANPFGWDDKPAFESISCILYGDQDYSDNTHKCYFDPEIVGSLFKEAGFDPVKIQAYGARDTDMCVEAIRPKKIGLEQFVVPRPLQPRTESTPFVSGFEVSLMNQKRQQDVQTLMNLKSQLDTPKPNVLGTTELCGNLGPNGLVCDRPKGHEGQCSALSAPQQSAVIHATYEPEKIFTEGYYNGTTPGRSIFPSGFYWDVTLYRNAAKKVLDMNPKSVLELGCGRGYVLRHLEDAEIDCIGFDVSQHCWHTRATNVVNVGDVTKGFTGIHREFCFSMGFWEHIPEHLIPPLIEKMSKASKRGLHGITFAEVDDGKDSTRCTLKPRDWWLQRMPPTHHICPKLDLLAGELPAELNGGDGLVKLNLGCGQTMFHFGWNNIDNVAVQSFATAWNFKFLQHDLIDGIPNNTGEVDLIYCSHMLEHLSYDNGRKFLRDCRRVLKPGGSIRISVPDAMLLTSHFLGNAENSDIAQFDHLNGDCAKAKTNAAKFWWMLCEGDHKSCYDFEALRDTLIDAGFKPRLSHFRDPESHPKFRKETIDMCPTLSLFMEATA